MQEPTPRVLVGTSGYNYPEWRGSFYPEKFTHRQDARRIYAERFPTVEINYTFYRMPTEKLLAGWAAGTPDDFTFTLKAPRRITHDAKLQRCEDLLQAFCRTPARSGRSWRRCCSSCRRRSRRTPAVLRAFVELLPDGTPRRVRVPPRVVVRRRGLRRRCAARNLALCIADSEKLSTPVEMTADYAYFRLRDEGYQQADIERWAGTIRELSASSDAFVYFKHEEQGLGPEFATAR